MTVRLTVAVVLAALVLAVTAVPAILDAWRNHQVAGIIADRQTVAGAWTSRRGELAATIDGGRWPGGQWVYVQLDGEARTAYVGRTNNLARRFAQHAEIGRAWGAQPDARPLWATWWAVACLDDLDARQQEQALIDSERPYQNERQEIAS